MKKKINVPNLLKEYVMVLVLIALIAIFSIICPILMNGRQFLTWPNMMNILGQNAYLMIAGVGITFIMLGGAMDLSTGFLLSTVGILMTIVDNAMGNSPAVFVVTLLVGVVAAVLLSGFNGVMYAWLSVFPDRKSVV